jgi:hypothetical protein
MRLWAPEGLFHSVDGPRAADVGRGTALRHATLPAWLSQIRLAGTL